MELRRDIRTPRPGTRSRPARVIAELGELSPQRRQVALVRESLLRGIRYGDAQSAGKKGD